MLDNIKGDFIVFYELFWENGQLALLKVGC